MQMSKLEMLFVRACKSSNPSKRVDSIYRRFYLSSKRNNDHAISSILLTICENYHPIPVKELVNGLNPANNWMFVDTEDYFTLLKHVLISHIMLSKAQCWIEYGFVKPLMWRK